MQDHVDWRGLIVPSLPFPIYRKFRIRGTNGLAARPKCGCELSPRPYFFSADRLCEGEATEKENSPGTLISRLFLSADSRTPTCMRELSHGPGGSVTLVEKISAGSYQNHQYFSITLHNQLTVSIVRLHSKTLSNSLMVSPDQSQIIFFVPCREQVSKDQAFHTI